MKRANRLPVRPGARRMGLDGFREDARRRGRHRRGTGGAPARGAVPAVGRPPDRPGRLLRHRPRHLPPTGAHPRPRGARGAPLAENDDEVRRAIGELGDRIDGAAALRSWEESLAAPAYDGPGRWLHGDLLPGNLLAVDGRLSAVIDFGGLNVGDPACDLMPAWNVFTRPEPATVPRRTQRRRRRVAARPRLGAHPGGDRPAVLLGHQPRHGPPGVAGPSPKLTRKPVR